MLRHQVAQQELRMDKSEKLSFITAMIVGFFVLLPVAVVTAFLPAWVLAPTSFSAFFAPELTIFLTDATE